MILRSWNLSQTRKSVEILAHEPRKWQSELFRMLSDSYLATTILIFTQISRGFNRNHLSSEISCAQNYVARMTDFKIFQPCGRLKTCQILERETAYQEELGDHPEHRYRGTIRSIISMFCQPHIHQAKSLKNPQITA